MLRSNYTLVGFVIVAVMVSFGVSFLIARSDKGEINVNERIVNTDQSSFTTETNAPSEPSKPNGGLNPQRGAPENPAPAAPPEPTPQAENASSTEEGGEEESEEGETEGAPSEETTDAATTEEETPE